MVLNDSKFILPSVSIERIEKIIVSFYETDKSTTIKQISAKYNISDVDYRLTRGLLEEARIIVSEKEGYYRITSDFGLSFGKAIKEGLATQVSIYWGDTLSKVTFLEEIKDYIFANMYLSRKDLEKEIQKRAKRRNSYSSRQGAGTIIKILEKAKYISIQRKAGGKITILANKTQNQEFFINPERISTLRNISQNKYDLSKLIELSEEINHNYSHHYYYAAAILARMILDHIPPIFGMDTFNKVTNHYGGRSFRESMQRLENLIKIADKYAHEQIKKYIDPPNPTQIDFKANLDVLFGEIIILLKQIK